MGRRLNRIRRAAQHLIKVTRRFVSMCYCGEVRVQTEVKLVPESSVLNGDVLRPKVRVSNQAWCSCENASLEGRQHTCTQMRCCHSMNTKTEVSLPSKSCSDYSTSEHYQRKINSNMSSKSTSLTSESSAMSTPTPPTIPVAPISCLFASGKGDTADPKSKDETPSCDTSSAFVELIYATDSSWAKIVPTEVEIIHKLYEGHLGGVDLVKSSDGSSGRFIRKRLNTTAGYQEASTLLQCQSDFVVKLLAIYTTNDAAYLYMPYYNKRDLEYWLGRDPQRDVFREAEATFIVQHLLVALYVIHSLGVFHMDIKPGNIFLDNNGYPVLADFGGALLSTQKVRAHCYTRSYSSPEILLNLVADKMADLWAAACTFYEIVTGETPTLNLVKRYEKVVACQGVSYSVSLFSPVAVDFMVKQFKLDKGNRLGFQEGAAGVMRHPLLQTYGWVTLEERVAGKPSALCQKIRKLIRGT